MFGVKADWDVMNHFSKETDRKYAIKKEGGKFKMSPPSFPYIIDYATSLNSASTTSSSDPALECHIFSAPPPL